jgi:hypothetical protein
VPEDTNKAAYWFQRAAEQDDLSAQRHLAACFQEGLGVKRDLVEAFKWLRTAAAEDFLAERDLESLRPSLTKDQVAEAERRCREFRASKHSDSPNKP